MLRKSIFLISTLVLSLLLCSDKIEAQEFRGGFTMGMNVTKVIGDHIFGFRKYGFHGGAVGTIPLKGNFLFTLETLYSEKGSYQKRPTLYYRQYRLELDYVEIPMMIQYNDRDIITIGAGFAYGRLVDVKEWDRGVRTTASLTGANALYDRSDYQALVDLKFRLVHRLSMNIRYQTSIRKIRVAHFKDDFGQREWERNQYNNSLTFRVAWIFNDPLPDRD
jgi:hypothetical protein